MIALALFLIAMFAYRTFFKVSDEDLLLEEEATTLLPGSDILGLYDSLQTVTLDQSVLKGPAFRSLIDFSTQVPSQPIGRANPFDLIGR